MDVQDILNNVETSIKAHNAPHARRLLREVKQIVEDDIVECSLVKHGIADLNHGNFRSAYNDVNSASIVDQRTSFSVAM